MHRKLNCSARSKLSILFASTPFAFKSNEKEKHHTVMHKSELKDVRMMLMEMVTKVISKQYKFRLV